LVASFIALTVLFFFLFSQGTLLYSLAKNQFKKDKSAGHH